MSAKGVVTKKPTKAMTTPSAGNVVRQINRMNRWREQFNPLPGLTLGRARTLIETYARGEFADLMWTYGAPMMGYENADADWMALIERRSSALLEMDFEIKEVATIEGKGGAVVWPRGYDATLAEEQQAGLREFYEGIDNLYDAIEHFGMASFRGFSHVEKYRTGDGDVFHLEIVDQWSVVRDGLCGAWKYNPEGRQTNFLGLSDDLLIDPAHFVIREVKRPINRIGLIKAIRGALSDKDWDAFIEIYGLPSGVVIMPPNVPPGEESKYEAAATAVAEGGSGALPNESTYVANDSPRGNNPFRDRLDYLAEKLILAGTGGMLTMLARSGTGTLAGEAHEETFQKIARAEARKIGEMFQRQLDADFLDREFPGRERLAYFELCFNAETDAGQVVDDVSKLSTAGFKVDAEQIEERTGYRISTQDAETEIPKDPALDDPKPGEPKPEEAPITNRAQTVAADFMGVPPNWLHGAADIFRDIEALAEDGDLTRDELLAKINLAANRLPDLLSEEMVTDLAIPLEKAMSDAALKGARAGVIKQKEATA